MNRFLFLLLLATTPLPLCAHPGHSTLDHGMSHVLENPYHLAALILPAVVLLAIARAVSQSRIKRLICGGAATLLGLAVIQALRMIH